MKSSTAAVPSASHDAWRAGKLARWGVNAPAFMARFNPDVQRFCARNPGRCFTGDAPTLGQIERLYGANVSEAWLDIQLNDFVKFAGVKGKEQFESVIEQVLGVIIDNFGWLKVSEVMLFFQFCKAGRYGHFYGTVDPMVITEALQAFASYRAEQLARLDRQRHNDRQRELSAARQRAEQRGELISADEWREIAWLFRM